MNGVGAGGVEVEILADGEELATRAAAEVRQVLGRAVDRRARATWVLAGGSTPRRLYELLAAAPGAVDWRRVELLWGDERCVVPTSEASNFGMAGETLLASLPFAETRVHRVRGELEPARAARDYALRVRAVLADGPFDLVLLGLGEDGHVASLFPGALPRPGRLAVAVEGPAEPRWRVTLTPEALANARRLVYLVSGGAKAVAVAQALDPERRVERVSDLARPRSGETLWLLDRAAAALLPGVRDGLW